MARAYHVSCPRLVVGELLQNVVAIHVNDVGHDVEVELERLPDWDFVGQDVVLRDVPPVGNLAYMGERCTDESYASKNGDGTAPSAESYTDGPCMTSRRGEQRTTR